MVLVGDTDLYLLTNGADVDLVVGLVQNIKYELVGQGVRCTGFSRNSSGRIPAKASTTNSLAATRITNRIRFVTI